MSCHAYNLQKYQLYRYRYIVRVRFIFRHFKKWKFLLIFFCTNSKWNELLDRGIKQTIWIHIEFTDLLLKSTVFYLICHKIVFNIIITSAWQFCMSWCYDLALMFYWRLHCHTIYLLAGSLNLWQERGSI